ncbi:hypothetical protein DSO57_1036936 [Entomophthora muscae]|uniref:Uncharacterized protein n=1 Tax=Entomophthora muscae TaxID=34485 RepID=A0ACC2UL15_9FUNG|nr:hypothetical protein DSO57_1036936 [Entomophthora muscae]
MFNIVISGTLDKLEESYIGFFEFVKKQSAILSENDGVALNSLSLDTGLTFLSELCNDIEAIANSTSPLDDSELDAISRCISRFHSLIHQWITPALIKLESDKQLQPLLEIIFCKHAFIRPTALMSLSAFLRSKSLHSTSINSSATVTLWFNILNRLISLFSFIDCLKVWGGLDSASLKQRRLLSMISSLLDTYLAIPMLISNSRLDFSQTATSKLVLSNFLSHTGRLIDEWLKNINPNDSFQLGLFSRVLQKMHRVGYLGSIASAFIAAPSELLLHRKFQTVSRPFLQGLLQATDSCIDGLVLEGFGSKVDPADPVGRLIQSISSFGFEHPFLRNAVLPLLVDVNMKPPLPARLATHIVSLADDEFFSQLLHFLFTTFWPNNDFFLLVGAEPYQSRCFLFAFLISKAPVSALSAITKPVRQHILGALYVTNQETRVLELLIAQKIIIKARKDDKAILNLPIGALSSRAKELMQLLDGDAAPGPDLVTVQPEEVTSTSPPPDIYAEFPAPRYLQDCIAYLKMSEDDRFEIGMHHVFSLVQSSDIGSLNDVAPELIFILAKLPSPEIRAKSMALVLMRSFKYSARPLVEFLFKNMTVEHQLGALASLRQAVLTISKSSSVEDQSIQDPLSINQSKGVVTWKSARLVAKSISKPTAEGRGLFPSQLFFPMIRPLRIGGKVGFLDILLLEAILMLLSTTLYFSYHLPEQDLMREAYMGLLGHIRLHPDPKIQAAVLLGYSTILPEEPSPRWGSLDELPSLLDYCQGKLQPY